MKRSKFKENLKSILLEGVIIFLFYAIPALLVEEIEFSFAILLTAFLVGGIIFFFIIINLASNKKKPKVIRKSKHFLREFPQDYSVAIASLLVSNKFDESVDIPATILSLVGKSVLKYKNKKITAVSNADITNLSEHEKYLYECFLKRKKIRPKEFQSLVIEDAVNKGYLQKINLKDQTKIIVAKIIMFFAFPYIVVVPLAIFDPPYAHIIVPIAMIICFLGIFIGPAYLVSKDEVEQENPYKNTKLGQKELQKLLNLKDYLKEFSDFEKAEIEEAILWEDYVAYAYIFNINKNLYDEFEDIKQITHLF